MSKPVDGLKRKPVDLDCSLRGVKWKHSMGYSKSTEQRSISSSECLQ